MKKWFSIIVSLVLLCLHMPDSFAENVAEGIINGETRWVLTNDGELIVSGEGKMREAHYWEKNSWIPYKEQIKKVTVQEGLTSIAPRAFSECTQLQEVSIPAGVTVIGTGAFYKCAIASIQLPEGLKKIDGNSFGECYNLISVSIPSSVEEIAENAFQSCGIKNTADHDYCLVTEQYSKELNCSEFTIYVKSGSYAEKFAQSRQYAYNNGDRVSGRMENILSKTESIIQECIKAGMTDRDKAKALHNWIVYHSHYETEKDEDLISCSLNQRIAFTYGITGGVPGSILLEGVGSCGDYADAYALLLSRAGISNSLVHGEVDSGGHFWNKVLIDGNWYHVDVTFDDPGRSRSNKSGNERSKYFLVSEEQILKDHDPGDAHTSFLEIQVFPTWE